MGKKPDASGAAPPPEWNPCMKELWHVDFERESVNDDKWSCIVTAAIPAEAGDDEYIQCYAQCVNTGLREAVKIISMADVVELLKKSVSATDSQKAKPDKVKAEKPDKVENLETGSYKPFTRRSSQIVGLAAKYATLMDTDCKLPSDLMAALLKFLILNLKDENCFQKRVEAVKARKIREKVLKAKFIRSLKPYEISQGEGKSFTKVPSNILELQEPINDQPYNGPDLYIVLKDIYDPFCFSELVRLKVPFLAVVRVFCGQEKEPGKTSLTFVPSRVEANGRKSVLLTEFWEALRKNCMTLEGTKKFKDIAMIGYKAPPLKNSERNYSLQKLFDEFTWIQYSAYKIHRHHQMYLRELYVQRLVVSLEPLDLDKCQVYNKICDILITGQPLTPALVLYAIIEQVVAGVPETESVTFEYNPEFDIFLSSKSQSVSSKYEDSKLLEEKTMEFTTPCTECRRKIGKCPNEQLKNSSTSPGKKNRMSASEETSKDTSHKKQYLPEISTESLTNKSLPSKEYTVSEQILSQVLAERKAEIRKDKKWKAPDLCIYGDNVFFQMYHCDPRILTPETVINRFLKYAQIWKIWSKYPESPPSDRAFFNFHFSSLLKISQQNEESLKLKLYFAIAMKLLGMFKSYLYRGMEMSLSETLFSTGKDKMNKASKVKFEQNLLHVRSNNKNSNSLFKTYTADKSNWMAGRRNVKSDMNCSRISLTKADDSESLRKVVGIFSMAFMSHHSSGMCMTIRQSDTMVTPSGSMSDVSYHAKILSGLLDLPEISNLADPHFLSNKDENIQMIQSFKYYEKIHPHVMIQRLLEAEEQYNTTQYSYFTPTDTVIVIMINDYDYRGVFYTYGVGVLPTPVSLKDFYNFIHSNIPNWSLEQEEMYDEFILSVKEEVQAEEEKWEDNYLLQLKQEYCEMSQEQRNEFLETAVDLQSEPEVVEEELGDLRVKPRFAPPRKVSFVTTNLVDVRVQCKRTVNEFHSSDGMEVNVITDSWLYEPLSLLTLSIKRAKLRLHYHQWLGDEKMNTAFTFKTTSDIIFAFYKNDTEEEKDFNYHVNMSWPTGLMVKPVFLDSGLYVKQGYLAVCRSGWDIEEEESRCYLKNGHLLVFKENGDLDVLCGNGTKYIYESTGVPRYEIISTTGEVWEVRTVGPCRYRKKLRTTQKIFIGTDPKTQETYYRREDGVNCMLWPNGRLVTNYPDGTKITSTPYFDEEIAVEWSDEEKLYFLKMDSKQKTEVPEHRSRTILRNSSGPRMSELSTFTSETFVSVSCSYLMEHPKYCTVFFNPEETWVTLTMPQNLKVLLSSEGNYELHQEKHVLSVQGSTAEFSLTCDECGKRSTATIGFSDDEVLCRVTDFFHKGFLVHRNGKTTYQNNFQECDENNEGSETNTPLKTTLQQCTNKHTKSPSRNQRCFALNRDLSGVEFIHEESLGYDCYELPDDTYFDLHTDDPPKVSHTFLSPYSKVGYENWVMDYEDKDNSLPTNLKKKDLKELGVKNNPGNFFKYPFPKYHNRSALQLQDMPQKQVHMPKITVARTVKCLSPEPILVIQNIHAYIGVYQRRARDLCNTFMNQKAREELSKDQRHIKMKLKKIALTLNQSLKMYPHLCTQSPSTEKDIHYFGHFIQLMDEFKHQIKVEEDAELDCKQIPKPLPRSSAFPAIHEEDEPT